MFVLTAISVVLLGAFFIFPAGMFSYITKDCSKKTKKIIFVIYYTVIVSVFVYASTALYQTQKQEQEQKQKEIDALFPSALVSEMHNQTHNFSCESNFRTYITWRKCRL